MKRILAAVRMLWTAVLLTVPSMADVIDLPPEPPAVPGSGTVSGLTVLLIAAVLVAAAVLVWSILRARKRR